VGTAENQRLEFPLVVDDQPLLATNERAVKRRTELVVSILFSALIDKRIS
jgi:hypothetical protein